VGFLKKLFAKLKNPNAVIVIFALVIFIASLTLSILAICAKIPEILGYVFYALAAVSLAYVIFLIVTCSKKIKDCIVSSCEKREWSRKFLKDYGFRTFIMFVVSTAINIAYAVYNGVYGIIFLSVWYGSLSLYYIALSLLRGGMVIRTVRLKNMGEGDNEQKRLRAYRLTGIFLILLPLALSAAIIQMALEGKAFRHAGVLIFVAAAYTFTKITMSVINLVKTRKTGDYILFAMRNIGLADSLVSVLALQTAMFAAFSNGGDYGWANGATGGAVCALTIILGLYMFINSSVKLKRAKENKVEEI